MRAMKQVIQQRYWIILKDNDVKAAFFITGAFVKSEPALVQRMVDEGHIVGNHTVNHVSLPTVSYEKAVDEINRLAQMYAGITNQKMKKYLRPPSGEFSESVTMCDQRSWLPNCFLEHCHGRLGTIKRWT